MPGVNTPAVAPSIQPLPPGSPRHRKPFRSPAGIKVAYEEDWTKQHFLECDGLCLQFYQMLQKKVVGREQYSEPVCIPETVVFEHNFPQAWFSYDEENKELIKRPGKMLDAATMYEFFSVPPVRGGGVGNVVAQFLHVSVPIETEWKDVMTKKEKQEGHFAGQHLTYVEFFTPETLNQFLFGQHRKPNGVLQRFVVPKGQGMCRKNMQIQLLWTPSITTAHMRVNRYRLDDAMVPFSDRLATYDGAPHLSQEMVVADETKNALTDICNEIAEQFHRTEKKRLSRLLLYFKNDDKNKLWLMWCGGLRVESDALSPSFLRVPLMLHMRKEILDDDTTTISRLQNRRRRQKQLLALDYELFSMTQDSDFAMNVNNTHRRQAKALNLRGIRNIKLNEASADPRRNPNHPLHESFIRICDEEDAESAPSQIGRKLKKQEAELSEAEMQARQGLPLPSGYGLQSEEDEDATRELVRKELVALALDAWYSLYSATLSLHPNVMPTSQMEMAPPLTSAAGVLRPEEEEDLTRILRISRTRREEATRLSSDGTALDHYRADRGVLSNARRLDRPSTQVEKEITDFFTQLFDIRGEEIVAQCCAQFPSFFDV